MRAPSTTISLFVAALAAVMVLASADAAQAYLDPGTGSMIV